MATKTTPKKTSMADRAGIIGKTEKAGITKYLPEGSKVKSPAKGTVISTPLTTVYSRACAKALKQLGFKRHFPEPKNDPEFFVYCKDIEHPLMENLRIFVEESGTEDIPWITVECGDQLESGAPVPIISCRLTAANFILVLMEFGKMKSDSIHLVIDKLGLE